MRKTDTCTIDELKEMLNVESDQEVADKLEVVVNAVYNWRREGRVSALAYKKAKKFVDGGGIMGSNNVMHVGQHDLMPEVAMLQTMLSHWDNKRKKKLLRLALELDSEE